MALKELAYLVIHCTATPKGRNITSDDIRKWHMSPPPEGRGWDRVGYSDMIHLNGKIENLTPYNFDQVVDPWEITWGQPGINSMSRHIVYVGGLDVAPEFAHIPEDEQDVNHMIAVDTRTPEQKYALEIYVKYMALRHPQIKVCGHNQWTDKACPSFDVPSWAESIGLSKNNIYYGKYTKL